MLQDDGGELVDREAEAVAGGVDAGASLADGVAECRVDGVVYFLGHGVDVEDGALGDGHLHLPVCPPAAQVHASAGVGVVWDSFGEGIGHAGRLSESPDGDGQAVGAGEEIRESGEAGAVPPEEDGVAAGPPLEGVGDVHAGDIELV